jgi:type II secretory pathway pseudopilin PulG
LKITKYQIQQPPCRTGACFAFTIPEMLAVVAIMIIVIAMLLPAIGKARDVAHAATCLGNVRQISVAHTSYKVNHLGWHPPTSTLTAERHWLELMEEYHSGNDVLRFCARVKGAYLIDNPAGSGQSQTWGSRDHHWWLNMNSYGVRTANGGSYGANSWLHSTTGWGQDLSKHFRRNSDIYGSASDVPVVSDSVWHNGFPKPGDTALIRESHGSQAPSGMMNRLLLRRHFAHSVNASFYDGSAKRVHLTNMWSFNWHKDFAIKDVVSIPWMP